MSIRLGMQWQELDPNKEAIRAAGNGHSLSSFPVRGLGVVVRFSPDLGTYTPSDLIPSKAADKMMCGILPGCSELAIKYHHLINDNKQWSNIETLLNDLRAPAEVIKVMSRPIMKNRMAWWDQNIERSPFADAEILLCPFMPFKEAPNCCAVQFLSYASFAPCSVFTYHEGRLTLLSEVTKRVKSYSSTEKCAQYLSYVQKTIADLEMEYPNQFFGSHLKTHGRKQNKSRSDLVNTCRTAFEETTAYFNRLQTGQDRPPLPYKQIVGAHVTFGNRAADWVLNQGYPKMPEKEGSLYWTTFRAWPQPEGIDPINWQVRFGAKTMVDVAWAYVERQSNFAQGIRARLGGSNGQHPYSDVEIEEMWWMLMLRGLVWALSVRIDT